MVRLPRSGQWHTIIRNRRSGEYEGDHLIGLESMKESGALRLLQGHHRVQEEFNRGFQKDPLVSRAAHHLAGLRINSSPW